MAVPKKRTSTSKKRIRKNLKKVEVLGSIKGFFISEISFYREFKKKICTPNKKK